MRKSLISLLLPLLMLPSCTKGTAELCGDGLKVSISCSTLTKAGTQNGEDRYHENTLTDAWVFLFPSGSLNNNDATASTFFEKVTLNSSDNATFTINPTLEQVENSIFASGASSCDIFVLVNWKGAAFTSAPTMAALKALVASADFKGTNGFKVQDDFVMTGSGSMSLDRSTTPYSGSCNISLKRLASKLTVSVHISQTVHGLEKDWTPDYQNISVQILNARNKGLLSGAEFSHAQGASETDNGIFDFDTRYGTAGEIQGATYQSVGPFYSYANSWTDPFDEENSTYAVIRVPFTDNPNPAAGATVTYQAFTYKVRLGSSRLEPNKWYTQRVNIELLGTLHDGTPTEITDNTFTVKDWSEVSTDIRIEDHRLLDVTFGDVDVQETKDYNVAFGLAATHDALNVVMLDNLDEVNIALSSSHPVTVTSVEKYYYDFSGNTASKVAAGTVTPAQDGSVFTAAYSASNSDLQNRNVVVTVTEKGMNKVLNVRHALDNRDSDNDSKYDVSAFYIKLHIRHSDKTDDTQSDTYSDIYLVQKPAISIVAEYTGDTYGTGGACLKVNNGTVGGTRYDYNLGSNGTNSGTNTNFNQYVISISRLNPNSPYVIADPRVDKENASSFWSEAVSAKYISGHDADGKPTISISNRKLSYYRPARTSGDANALKNQIAPSYRFASSHGATSDVTETDAARRCATYQENGCPAGRWRLPTVAEVRFAMSLSANGMIPFLFGSEEGYMDYWVSTGLVRIDRSKDPVEIKEIDASDSHPVRCVYDEWYWTDKLTDSQKSTFTWGDMQ